MAKQKRTPQKFNQRDIEILLRARRESKTVSFDNRGHPVIRDAPREFHPRRPAKPDTAQLGAETVGVRPCSLLSSIEDVLTMSENLELFAAHCSERLSEMERRREDCIHQFEPQRDENGVIVDFLPDDMLLAIGRKLRRIGAERRNIKNRFEVIKAVKRGFVSHPGQEALAFLRGLLTEAACIVVEQRQRTYTPRTDELDDLFDEPRPKYIDLNSILPDDGGEDCGYEDPLSILSEEMLTQLLREYEAADGPWKEVVPV